MDHELSLIKADCLIGQKYLERQLLSALKSGKKVLWLVSGGSNIPISVSVAKALPEHLTTNLTIMLADERFGRLSHPNSNSQQLLTAGFNYGLASFYTILNNLSLQATVQNYQKIVVKQFNQADQIIAQLGLGTDSHIAGILPNSVATKQLDNNQLVISYQAQDFERITLTFEALRYINIAFVFAYGISKKQAIENLLEKNSSLKDQPAQILKDISQSYVYNDSVEGRVIL